MNSKPDQIIDMEEELLKPYTHIMPARSGELLYKEIPLSLQYWLNIPDDKLQEIRKITEMTLNMLLLVDDMQDQSLFRRTVPAAHRVYGTPLTINTCLHLYGLALQKVFELGHPKAANILVAQLIDALRGQGTDIVRREKGLQPNEQQYKSTAELKSAGFFLLPMRLMQLYSDNKTDYSKLIKLFGVYYEIRDDYCNLMKPDGLEGRDRKSELQNVKETSFCEDLTDGKFSWPAIHALRSPEGSVITYLLKKKTRDLDLKNLYIDTLTRLGSLQYTRDVLHEYNNEMRKELARLGGNPVFEALLDDFMDWAE